MGEITIGNINLICCYTHLAPLQNCCSFYEREEEQKKKKALDVFYANNISKTCSIYLADLESDLFRWSRRVFEGQEGNAKYGLCQQYPVSSVLAPTREIWQYQSSIRKPEIFHNGQKIVLTSFMVILIVVIRFDT